MCRYLDKFIYIHFFQWVHLAAIEDLCFLSTTDDGTVEISRKTGIPIHLKFLSTSTMFSFITLLNGYYRLMVNWNFDLCASTNTPSLSKLKSIRSHGPIRYLFLCLLLPRKIIFFPPNNILLWNHLFITLIIIYFKYINHYIIIIIHIIYSRAQKLQFVINSS